MIILGQKSFSKYFDDVLIINKNEHLDSPVSSHPDMNVLIIDNTVFLEKDYYLSNFFENKNYKVVYIEESFDKIYPYDVRLNCKQIGNKILMNTKTISKTILNFCKETNKKIIDVPQGYASCSTLCLNENAFITADIGVYNALKSSGVHPLLIEKGYINIEKYDYGFIGGASGFINGVLYFFGDITKHPDFTKIDEYLNKHNVKYKWFDTPLTDIGGCLEI